MQQPIISSVPIEYADYVIVGAGPAAICAVAKLYGLGISGKKIQWIDPVFKVGDFGSVLSVGSGVPGNTSVLSYQRVNKAIYALIPECAPTVEEANAFEITKLPLGDTCSLTAAAKPLQAITDHLRRLVNSIEGVVVSLTEVTKGIQLVINSRDQQRILLAKRVILAVGAKPRSIPLPDHLTLIEPTTVFIRSALADYLAKNPAIQSVAVIGSSHSAALATMHLLQAGVSVKQLMNKPYRFAAPKVTDDGKHYTEYDNTGLKGTVAAFTKQLLEQVKQGVGPYVDQWHYEISDKGSEMRDCTHAVTCIGYEIASSLEMNGISLANYRYDADTTQLLRPDGCPMTGVFGIGIAYPLRTKTITGETEMSVGIEKFWVGMDERIVSRWC